MNIRPEEAEDEPQKQDETEADKLPETFSVDSDVEEDQEMSQDDIDKLYRKF